MQTFGVDPTELLIGNLFATGCRADAAANLFVSQSHRCLLASLAFNTTGLDGPCSTIRFVQESC